MKACGFGTTWGWVNNNSVFSFVWTVPLRKLWKVVTPPKKNTKVWQKREQYIFMIIYCNRGLADTHKGNHFLKQIIHVEARAVCCPVLDWNASFHWVQFHLLKPYLTIRDHGDNATSVTELLTLLYIFQIEDICEPLLSLAVWCMDATAWVRSI